MMLRFLKNLNKVLEYDLNSRCWLGIDIMYYWTSDKEYAYSHYFSSSGEMVYINKYVNGIYKVGFSLAWDIL